MDIDRRLFSPFTAEQVQRINETQTRTGDGFPTHPYTCPNRDDGRHGEEGGDLGVLIATEEGLVCPHCDYTQSNVHSVVAQKQPELVALLGQPGHYFMPPVTSLINERLAGYRDLARQGASGAQVMVDCLERRQQELLEREEAWKVNPLVLWVVYDQPSDYPDAFVARKWTCRQVSDHGVESTPTDEVMTAGDLEALRAMLPPGVTKIPRASLDDPKIVETWLQ